MDLPVLLRMIVALSLVLGLIFGSVWLFRRFGPLRLLAGRSQEFKFDVVGQTHLGPKRSLMAVRVAGRTLLLGLTPTAISFLAELDPERPAEAGTPPAAPVTPGPFGEELAMALTGLDRSRARLSGEGA